MNKTRNLWVVGAMALAAGVFFACGESGNGGSGAGSDIPTDGIFGELPALNEQWLAEQEQMREKIENEANDDKRTKLNEEFSEWEKARKEKAIEVLEALKGKEIPTEAAEGVPFQFDGNLMLDYSSSYVSAYRRAIKMQAKCMGTLTADLADITVIPNYIFVAYDADGQVIKADCYATAQYKGDKDAFDSDKTGDAYQFSPMIEVTADWARLAKMVLMDKTSDAYKQVEAQMKGE